MSLLSFLSRQSSANDPPKLASPAFKANPYPFYARLRAESPVYKVALLQGEPAWLVTRYNDVSMVLKDERFIKNDSSVLTPEQMAARPWFRKLKLFKTLQHNMLNQDPPVHTRLRALVNKAFTPPLIGQMRERIQEITNELLDNVQHRARMDLIRDFALPLPATVIAEMLGVPVEDRHKFHRWSNAMMTVSSTWQLLKAIPQVMAFIRYNRKNIQIRRGASRGDLVSALTRAEEAGDTLREDEVVAMVGLLLVAGHETTVNLIGNGMLALLEHPGQMEKLRNDPALIKSAVEEFLRYSSPVEMATERFAREDVTIGGVTIRRGDMVFAVIASANRDERQIPNPDTLDIAREPNKHLAFGLGNHFCLGAPLARLEGEIAINTLIRRVPDLQIGVPINVLRWRSGLLLRGLESLPVSFGKVDSNRADLRVSSTIAGERPTATMSRLGQPAPP
jgi:cytochrome P450 PksS